MKPVVVAAYASSCMRESRVRIHTSPDCVLANGHIHGLWRLTVLTSVIQLSPIFLIWMFPKDKHAVFASLEHEYRSKPAGALFVVVLMLSILGTLCYSIVTIYDATDDDDCSDDDDD